MKRFVLKLVKYINRFVVSWRMYVFDPIQAHFISSRVSNWQKQIYYTSLHFHSLEFHSPPPHHHRHHPRRRRHHHHHHHHHNININYRNDSI